MKLIVPEPQQDNTILLSGRKEHPLIFLPLMFIFCFRFSCILSTDIGGDRSATIIWACLSFFLAKVNSQGFDSTITSPNFWMLVVIFFRPASNLYVNCALFTLSLLTSACKLVSCVSTSFSICCTAKYVCRSDAYCFMLTTFVWYSVSSFFLYLNTVTVTAGTFEP